MDPYRDDNLMPVEPKDPYSDENLVAVQEPPKTVYAVERDQVLGVPSTFDADEVAYKAATDVDGRKKGDFLGMVDLGADFGANLALGLTRFAVSTPSWMGSLVKEFGATRQFGNITEPFRPDDPREMFKDFFRSPEEVLSRMERRRTELTSVDRRIMEKGQRMIDENKKFLELLGGVNSTDKTGASKFAFDLGSGTGSVALSIGASVVAKDPRPMAVLFGLMQKGQDFEQSLEAGKTAEDASSISSLTGTVNGMLEFAGISAFLKMSAISKPFQRILARMSEEAGQEFTQQFSTGGILSVAGVDKKEFAEIFADAIYAGTLGFLVSAPTAVAVGAHEGNFVKRLMANSKLSQEQAQKVVAQMVEAADAKLSKDDEFVAWLSNFMDRETSPLNVTPEEKAQAAQEAQAMVQKIVSGQAFQTPEQVKQGRLTSLIGEQKSVLRELDLMEKNKSLLAEDERSTKRLDKQLANLAQRYDVLDSEIAEILTDKNVRIDENARVEYTVRQELRKIRQAVAAEVRAKAQGKVEGAKAQRLEISGVQSTVLDLVQQSNLDPADRAKFLTDIKNTQTFEQLDKVLPGLEAKVRQLQTRAQVKRLKTKIKSALDKTKPIKSGGKPVGKMTPEIQKIMDRAREASKLSRQDAESKILMNLAGFQQGGTPTAATALENRILSIFGGLEDQNPMELQDALDEIDKLVDQGKGESLLKKLLEKEIKEDLVQGTLQTVQGRKPADPSKPFPSTVEILQQWQATVGKSFSGWDDLMNILAQDDAARPGESFLERNLRVNDVETAEKQGVRLSSEAFVAAASGAYGVNTERQLLRQFRQNAERQELGTFTDAAGNTVQLTISKNEAIYAYMLFQDESLLETLTSDKGGVQLGTLHVKGVTPDMLQAVDNFLTSEDVAFADAMQQNFYRKMYDRINAKYRETYGIDLPFNAFYVPISRVAMKEAPVDTFLQEIGFRKSIAPSALKTRVENFRPIRIQDAVEVAERHVAEMEHFLAWVDRIGELNAVFTDSRVRNAVEQKYGPRIVRIIDGFIQDFTRNGTTRATGIEHVLSYFRRNFTTSVLGLKPAIAIKQMVSFMAYAEYVPVKDFAAGVADLANIGDLDRKLGILNQSELFRNRTKSITRDIKDALESQEFALFRKNASFKNWFLLTTKFGDKTAIVLGGWPVYRYATEVKGMSHEDALNLFEKATSATQQSGDISQLSEFQRGSEFAKLFSMFVSAQNQYLRREISAIRNFSKGKITPGEFAKKIFMYHFFLPMLFQYISDFGRWDAKEQLRAAIMGSLNGFFIFGDIIDAAVRGLLDMPIFDNDIPAFEFKRGVLQAINTLQEAEDMWDVMEAVTELSGQTAGPLLGLPIQYILNAYEGLQDLGEGEVRQGVGKLAGWSPFVLEKE